MDFRLIIPILVTVVGSYLLIKLGAFYILHPIKTATEFCRGLKDRSSRRAFFLALAGTLGVGNIFGVCAGIIIGGPGSIFWLFVSSAFAMIIKYAETLLVFSENVGDGGMAAVLRSVFGKTGKKLSMIYAAMTVLLSFFMGSAMQAVALTDITRQTYGISPLTTSVILLVLLIPILFGNGKKIENITEIVIPMTTIIYIIACLCVIFANFSRLGETIMCIISSAFSPRAALGGGLSFVALREGFARGILSNEAGVGTSALAHSRATNRTPHQAGLFAMSEVVFDSSVLCILTGIAVLLSVPDYSVYKTPMSLAAAAFNSLFGSFSDVFLPVVILAFAYSTIICWFYYGSKTCDTFFNKHTLTFKLCFCLSALLCSYISQNVLIYITDIILLIMSLFTLSAIVVRSQRITELSIKKSAPD